MPASFACDDMVSDGESWCSAPYNSIWDDVVIPNRDRWALWMGTVVIALHGASECQCDMQGQVDDSSIISSPSLVPFLTCFCFPLCLLSYFIHTLSSPLHLLLSASNLLPRPFCPTQPLASLSFTHPRPPAVCPPL